jgi:hypothetical protein
MPVTSNGLVYTTATVITQSQSITGSFVGCLALASGSVTTTPAIFTGLRDLAGGNIATSNIPLMPGTTLNINITSASLGAASAPVMLFVI